MEIQAVETFLVIRADVKKKLKTKNRKVSIVLIHNRVALLRSHLYWGQKSHFGSVGSFLPTYCSEDTCVSARFNSIPDTESLLLCTLETQDIWTSVFKSVQHKK